MSQLHEIQSILDESKETISSDLYNKLSIACKKSFESKKDEKLYVKVKIMFFVSNRYQDNNTLVPKFRFEIIQVTNYQLRVLLRRNEEGKFTAYRNEICKGEQTIHNFSDKFFCENCEEVAHDNFQVCTGEYIVFTYKKDHLLTIRNFFADGHSELRQTSFSEGIIPLNEPPAE